MAHSSEGTLAGVLRDALLQLEGAFSLVFLVEDRIVVARDPPGFRPLAVLAGDKSYALYRECAGQGSVEVRDKT
jgi:glutamine phosphoribosylpyrophosphate amidotransferase